MLISIGLDCLLLHYLLLDKMQPVFHSDVVGLDWPILLVGHIVLFISLSLRFDWSWIPLTEHERLCGSEGDKYRFQVNLLEKTYKNS